MIFVKERFKKNIILSQLRLEIWVVFLFCFLMFYLSCCTKKLHGKPPKNYMVRRHPFKRNGEMGMTILFRCERRKFTRLLVL